jgi:hypothetical protein
LHVEGRFYKGEYDLPKSNRVRTIALLPQAREAVEALPERDGLVFRSKRGRRLAQPTMSVYWSQVLARARLDFDLLPRDQAPRRAPHEGEARAA